MKILRILILLAIPLLAASCLKDKDETFEEYVLPGDVLPDFTVQGQDHAVYRSSQAQGKVTLICFFITTCPDCHRELPKVQQVWEALGGEPEFDLLAIGRGHTLEEIAEF